MNRKKERKHFNILNHQISTIFTSLDLLNVAIHVSDFLPISMANFKIFLLYTCIHDLKFWVETSYLVTWRSNKWLLSYYLCVILWKWNFSGKLRLIKIRNDCFVFCLFTLFFCMLSSFEWKKKLFRCYGKEKYNNNNNNNNNNNKANIFM